MLKVKGIWISYYPILFEFKWVRHMQPKLFETELSFFK